MARGTDELGGVVAHIGHVELLTPSLDQSVEFFVDLLGMQIVADLGGSAYLRGYGNYELVGLKLTQAPAAGVGHIGLRARSDEDLAAIASFAIGRGAEDRWIDGDRGHGAAFHYDGPSGHRFEVYWETELATAPTGLPQNRFGKRRQGAVGVSRIDHLNLFSQSVSQDRANVQSAFGARCLDIVLDDDDQEAAAFTSFSVKPLEVVFTADRSNIPSRLHHLAFWVDTREDVLSSADVFLENGVKIEMPPSLHTVGQSFFCYVFEPGGNRIEITTGADFQFDPAPTPRVWTAETRRSGIGWGTSFPASWSSYGTPHDPLLG